MSALLMMVVALIPCLAGAPAWASADTSNSQGGDFTLPSAFARDGSQIDDIRRRQFSEEDRLLLAVENATGAEQDDFILTMRQGQEGQSPVVPVSTACVAISPVGNVGMLYLGIPRINGSCQVNIAKLRFYLNDQTCTTENSCEENLESDIPCRYSSPQALSCDNEEVPGPCIDDSDVEAAINVICAPDNAACNECINWETGSPTCTDYRTPLGVRIKMCVLENGKTCPWKKCCKKRLLDHEKCNP
jgi:hypothetical protein